MKEYRVRYETMGCPMGVLHSRGCKSPNGPCTCDYIKRTMVLATSQVFNDKHWAEVELRKHDSEITFIEEREVSEWRAPGSPPAPAPECPVTPQELRNQRLQELLHEAVPHVPAGSDLYLAIRRALAPSDPTKERNS